MPDPDIIEHEEKKSSWTNNLKHISKFQLIIFFGVIGVLLYYWKVETKYLIGFIITVIFIYIFAETKSKSEGIDMVLACKILDDSILKLMRIRNSPFPRGKLVVTGQGYCPPYDYEVYHIDFYIVENESGLQRWYVGKVERQGGQFVGYHKKQGEKSGKPPRDFGLEMYGPKKT